ncbi:hypothetical protein FRAAL6403 [Frankia alni ACN14a]|uniref:Uncharacterized protein n=1 Tax=Frankia alni (strain DSM 45986 / CECT 9034 / ACN14a) TaxID=326424 RepID=Q0RC04_FRAAA|nr:hypothetical protein FRAAL6403 [Frankia alni ACN14a]
MVRRSGLPTGRGIVPGKPARRGAFLLVARAGDQRCRLRSALDVVRRQIGEEPLDVRVVFLGQ